MRNDPFDEIRSQWLTERPDVDTAGLEVIGRILLLSKMLKSSAKKGLGEVGLDLWAFEVLAALRRQGAPYRMNPSAISRSVVVSSGAMTNRLDRLEMSGLVERRPDPEDRRAIVIELTGAGLDLVNKAIQIRAEEANRYVEVLDEAEREALIRGLRKLLSRP